MIKNSQSTERIVSCLSLPPSASHKGLITSQVCFLDPSEDFYAQPSEYVKIHILLSLSLAENTSCDTCCFTAIG